MVLHDKPQTRPDIDRTSSLTDYAPKLHAHQTDMFCNGFVFEIAAKLRSKNVCNRYTPTVENSKNKVKFSSAAKLRCGDLFA